MIHTVKLIPQTNKARGSLHNAGKPEHWSVLEERETVGFSPRPGPWLHVSPQGVHDAAKHSRWVSLTDDPNFVVEVVR